MTFKLDRHVKPPKVELQTDWTRLSEYDRGLHCGQIIKLERDPAKVQEFLNKTDPKEDDFSRGFFIGLGGTINEDKRIVVIAGGRRQGKTNTARVLSELEKAGIKWTKDKNASWRGK